MPRIENLASVIEIAASLMERLSVEELWWRGHSRSSWDLTPRVYREGFDQIRERNLTEHFRLRAGTRHPKCPTLDDLPGWLTLMQHYGLPTRLLDWTQSVLFALFFAVRHRLDEEGTLWALSPALLNASQRDSNALFTSHSDKILPLFRDAFAGDSSPSDSLAQQKGVFALLPREVDIRMTVQLSAFTIHGSVTPLDKRIDCEKFVAAYPISSDAKKTIGKELELIGVTRAGLFPDLENLAKWVEALTFSGTGV